MTKRDISEEEIIRTIKNGDFRHFDELVNRYSNYVFRVSMKVINQAEDAEDCLQETFLKLFRSISNYNSDSKFSTWLYRISVNTCLDKIRKNLKHNTADIEIDQIFFQDADKHYQVNPEKTLLAKELSLVIKEAIRDLPAKLQAAVILADIRKTPYARAAEKLGITLPAYKSRLRRARRQIRDKISHYIKPGLQS